MLSRLKKIGHSFQKAGKVVDSGLEKAGKPFKKGFQSTSKGSVPKADTDATTHAAYVADTPSHATADAHSADDATDPRSEHDTRAAPPDLPATPPETTRAKGVPLPTTPTASVAPTQRPSPRPVRHPSASASLSTPPGDVGLSRVPRASASGDPRESSALARGPPGSSSTTGKPLAAVRAAAPAALAGSRPSTPAGSQRSARSVELVQGSASTVHLEPDASAGEWKAPSLPDQTADAARARGEGLPQRGATSVMFEMEEDGTGSGLGQDPRASTPQLRARLTRESTADGQGDVNSAGSRDGRRGFQADMPPARAPQEENGSDIDIDVEMDADKGSVRSAAVRPQTPPTPSRPAARAPRASDDGKDSRRAEALAKVRPRGSESGDKRVGRKGEAGTIDKGAGDTQGRPRPRSRHRSPRSRDHKRRGSTHDDSTSDTNDDKARSGEGPSRRRRSVGGPRRSASRRRGDSPAGSTTTTTTSCSSPLSPSARASHGRPHRRTTRADTRSGSRPSRGGLVPCAVSAEVRNILAQCRVDARALAGTQAGRTGSRPPSRPVSPWGDGVAGGGGDRYAARSPRRARGYSGRDGEREGEGGYGRSASSDSSYVSVDPRQREIYRGQSRRRRGSSPDYADPPSPSRGQHSRSSRFLAPGIDAYTAERYRRVDRRGQPSRDGYGERAGASRSRSPHHRNESGDGGGGRSYGLSSHPPSPRRPAPSSARSPSRWGEAATGAAAAAPPATPRAAGYVVKKSPLHRRSRYASPEAGLDCVAPRRAQGGPAADSPSRSASARPLESEEAILEEVEYKLEALAEQIAFHDFALEQDMMSSPFERLYHMNNRRDRIERRELLLQYNRLHAIREKILTGALDREVAAKEERRRRQEALLRDPNSVFLRLYHSPRRRGEELEAALSSKDGGSGVGVSANASSAPRDGSARRHRHHRSRSEQERYFAQQHEAAVARARRREQEAAEARRAREQREFDDFLVARLAARLQRRSSPSRPAGMLSTEAAEAAARQQLEDARAEGRAERLAKDLVRGRRMSARELGQLASRMTRQGYVSREKLERQKVEEEMRECTFHPKTNNYMTRRDSHRPTSARGGPRTDKDDAGTDGSGRGDDTDDDGTQHRTGTGSGSGSPQAGQGSGSQAERCDTLYRQGMAAKQRAEEVQVERDRELRLRILKSRLTEDHHFRKRVELDPSLAERFMRSLEV